MTFEFQLLSLLLVFLLLVIYFNKKDSFIKGNKVFRGILIISYLLEFIGMIAYIVVENNGNMGIVSRVYSILLMLWFSLYGAYYLVIYLKAKYIKDKNKLGKVTTNLSIYFWLIQILGGISLLLVPGGGSIFDCSGMLGYFIIVCLLAELVVLVAGSRLIDKGIYANLFAIFGIQLLFFFLQLRSLELPLLSIGVILSVYYCYFMLENTDREMLRNLTLERDYAKRQSIDKSNFLKVLSREIRIPLNTIDGFSQVILDSDNLEEIKTDVADIRAASRDLIDVINGMIDLSILESGNLEVLEENYNVYDMFEDIKNIAEAKMRDKSVEFKVEIDDDIPEVLLGDTERVSQIILNLLTNAIKYTDKGNITLKVGSVRSSTKCRLKIMVSDTGRGIKKEDIGSIFEGKTQREGASLGLAVSKYLLELMGGSIEAESTYGTGSKFIVTLDQKVISDETLEKVSRKRALRPFKASGKRILLVDDNKLNLKVAMKLLQPYDVEVVEATSGRECLDILDKDTNFDLVLMDDMMPEMSGTECLDILKKIERVDGFYIPVVVLTANAVGGMKEKYLNAGFEDYLAKPIDKYELDRILKKYLKGKK